MHFEGFWRIFRIHGVDFRWLSLALARGPYLFLLVVFTPAQSSALANQLMSNLAAAQWHKVPDNTPDTATSTAGTSSSDTAAGAAGAFLGILIGYLGIVNGIAYLRNPRRRPRRYSRSELARRWPAGFEVRDVAFAARSSKSTALARLVVQLFGLSIAAGGARGPSGRPACTDAPRERPERTQCTRSP